MGEANSTLDVSEVRGGLSIFKGVDWGGSSGWTALRCPRCSTRHQWHSRRPKRCRHCDMRFGYTANELSAQDTPPNPQEAK